MGDFKLLLNPSSLEELHKRQNQAISFEPPQILDIMETDGDGNVLKRKPNLRYFKEPKRTSYPLDLTEGFEDFKFRVNNPSSLRKITKYLMEKGDDENDTNEMCKIYAERSAIYHIMINPYHLRWFERNGLTIYATKFNDAIFLKKIGNDGVPRNSKNDTFHFKCEQYCFSDEFGKEPRTDLPIDANKQIYCVYRTQLKEFDIYYSAEINGIISDHKIKDSTNIEELNKCRFVGTKLLKFSRNIDTSFRKHPNALSWWAQGFLGRTDDIYVGFKNDGLIQEPIKHVRVKDLPENQKWKPSVCNAFLHQFLTMIQDKMSDVNCPYTVYEYKFRSTSPKDIMYKIHKGETKCSFLDKELVKLMQNKK